MRLLVFNFLIIATFSGVAQSSQGEYLEAKRQFGLGGYKVAMQSFQELTNDQIFGEYASFYYALSAFRLHRHQVALDMWKQIRVKYPDWDKNEEVNFWIAYTSLKQGKFLEAVKELETLPEDWKNHLMDFYFGGLSLKWLDSAYALHPTNQHIARYYAKAIKQQPYNKRNQLMLEKLSGKFEEIAEQFPLVKKNEYAIAVVLPFMFESLKTPQTVIRNLIIFDLYLGMKYAENDLKKEGINLHLFPFDTKKNKSVTHNLIKEKKLDNADVIIGPLYGGPNKYISQFSRENKITMINPVSSNEEIIWDNPYAYLFKSGYSTQGREAARYAAKKFADNKKVFIFYETDRDSIIAGAYRKRIEKDSFFVMRFERLTPRKATQIQEEFTEQYEFSLNKVFNQDEIDSIVLIPERRVQTRRLIDKKTGQIIKDDEGNDVVESYEMKFIIRPNSIGHIFAATSSNYLANNLINMIEVRSDSIGLIGYEDWLDFSLVSYRQLERLHIDFLSPSYFDSESDDYKRFEKSFIEKTGVDPTEYNVYGYELIMQLGRLMKKHGKYLPRGVSSAGFQPGLLMEGMKYDSHNDNQIVPVTTIRNLKLQNQNKQKEAEKTKRHNDK